MVAGRWFAKLAGFKSRLGGLFVVKTGIIFDHVNNIADSVECSS